MVCLKVSSVDTFATHDWPKFEALTPMKKLFFLFVGILVWHTVAFSQKNYFDYIREAKLHIANHRPDLAIPALEQVYNTDSINANICYMLGMCYVKMDTLNEKAIRILKWAERSYTDKYDYKSIEERRAPEYVYYYLLIAYSQGGYCKKALETLNTFYKIYSYEDEWYLMDGQEWFRECDDNQKDTTQADSSYARRVFRDRLVSPNKLKGIGTKRVEYSTKSTMYGVQVGALLEPKYTLEFERLKNVEVYMDRNGVFRYVVGSFLFRSQAEKLLVAVREQGYKDAFIVDLNQNEQFTDLVVTIEDESINKEVSGDIQFKVQIGAYRYEIPDYMARVYLKIDNIQEHTQDDLTILTVGNFTTYEEAIAYRNEMIQTGVNDAFVVAFNNGKKLPLDVALKYLRGK